MFSMQLKEINYYFGNIQFVVCTCFQFGHVKNSVVWEKVKSNFSFSHNVFRTYISLARQNAALCGNGLRQPWFKSDTTLLFTTIQHTPIRSLDHIHQHVLSLVLQLFPNLEAFENNTTSHWLCHTVPIRSSLTFKVTKSWKKCKECS